MRNWKISVGSFSSRCFKLIELTIKCKQFLTEDPEIIDRIFRFFDLEQNIIRSVPDEIGIIKCELKLEGLHSIRFLFRQIREQKIVEAFRRYLMNRTDINNKEIRFNLHKQALTQGHVVIADPPSLSPLGAIALILRSDDIEKLVDYLSPPTKAGKVLEVNYIPS